MNYEYWEELFDSMDTMLYVYDHPLWWNHNVHVIRDILREYNYH